MPHPDILTYHENLPPGDREICDLLAATIEEGLPEAESKIWHAHPVWFIDGNPIVGYSKQRPGWRLMFWSGASFEEEKLKVRGKKFRDASVFYTSAEEIDIDHLHRWLRKSREIQWDYKHLIKNKGRLDRLR